MFLNGWAKAQAHLDVAIVRYVYYPLIGFLLTFALTSFYNSRFFNAAKGRLVFVALACAVAALVTAVILNPITYLMVGYNIHNIPQEILSTGTLLFALIYCLWSAIYFPLVGQSLLTAPEPAGEEKSNVFRVEKGGEKRLLKDRDICFIRASGDYVELVTAENQYLVKETLTTLEKRLDGARFRRVHRSAIVNQLKLEKAVTKPGGVYVLTFEGDRTLTSSRSYKAIVEDILPKG